MKRLLLICAFLLALPFAANAQLSVGTVWKCSLTGLVASLTQCQAAAAAGYHHVITDIVVQTTTGTAGNYAIQTGTGTNCASATAYIFPASGTGSDRFTAPINSQATAVISPRTGIAAATAHAICVIGTATNTINIYLTGYTTR